jgi:hypothetical protein
MLRRTPVASLIMSQKCQTRNFLTALALSAFPRLADEGPFLRQLEGPDSLDA